EQLETLSNRLDQLSTAPEGDGNVTEQTITEITSQIDSLTTQVNTLSTPSETDVSGVETALSELTEEFSQFQQQFRNRPELQEIEQSQHAIADLTEQLDTLSTRLTQLPTVPEVDLSGVEDSLSQLAEQFSQLQHQFQERPELQEIEQSQRAIADLTQRLETLNIRLDQLPIVPEVDLSGIEQTIGEITGQVETLTERVNTLSTPTETDLSHVDTALFDLTEQVGQLQQQFQERPELQEIEQSQRAIADLTEQLDTLSTRLTQLPTTPDVDRSATEQTIAEITDQIETLTERVNTLSTPVATETDQSGIEAALSELAEQLSQLQQQFQNRPELQEMEQSQIMIGQLAEQLEILTNQLDQTSATPGVDLMEIGSAIVDVHDRLDQLTARFEQFPGIADTEPAPIQPTLTDLVEEEVVAPPPPIPTIPALEQIQQLPENEAIAPLTDKLKSLNEQFHSQPATQAVEGLKMTLIQLTDYVNIITSRLGGLPTTPDLDLSGLEQAITEVHTQLDAFNQQFNGRPEVQAIEQLQEAINQLGEQIYTTLVQFNEESESMSKKEKDDALKDIDFQLDAMELCLENLPMLADLDFSGVEAAIAAIDEQLDNLTQTIAENQAALFEVDLSGGEDAIEDINRQIEVLNQKISSQLDKATIEQLEDAIVHLKKQIEAVTFTLETLPVASDDMDFGGEEPDISDLQW
ncbi:MAG: hypothetical protein RIB93_07925, partial [Coleofasciculus sp. D1-CHI-01]|uniref:hypothetical protein n=1 Tax=Coleofasciculus sp. D1-CHI-01 TaxID=3068482 RepID=UPI0032FD8061